MQLRVLPVTVLGITSRMKSGFELCDFENEIENDENQILYFIPIRIPIRRIPAVLGPGVTKEYRVKGGL